MRTPAGAVFTRVRHWRRDDLEAFESLYSMFSTDHEIVWWPDANFPDVPGVDSGISLTLAGAFVGRAPIFSSASWSSVQGVAAVDDQQRVIRYLLDDGGTVVSNSVEVDPGFLGRSWGTPGITLGRNGNTTLEFVAWTAGELTTTTALRTRWAIRDVDGGEWMYFDGFEQVTPRVVVGYDDLTAQFVLGTLSASGDVEISLVGLDGVMTLERHQTGVAVSDLAAAVCDGGTCVVPVASTEIGGPQFGQLEVVLDEGSADVVDVTFINFDTFGRTGMSPDTSTYFRGVAGKRRFALSRGMRTPRRCQVPHRSFSTETGH